MSRKTAKSKSATAVAPTKPKAKSRSKSGTSSNKRSTSNKPKEEKIDLVTIANQLAQVQMYVFSLHARTNLIVKWIEDTSGNELFDKSSPAYKAINDHAKEVKDLEKKLSNFKSKPEPIKKKAKAIVICENGPETESAPASQTQDQSKVEVNSHEEAQKEGLSPAGPEEIKNEEEQQSDNHVLKDVKEADKSIAKVEVAEGKGNSAPAETERVNEEASTSNSAPKPAESPETAVPEPRPLTSFEKSRLAMYQRTLQERRKSNAAAAAAKEQEERSANELSPPPPKITRIDAEPETSRTSATDDEHSDPPKLEHERGHGHEESEGESRVGGVGQDPGGHFLEIIPSPGIGRLQKRGRCVICSKKKIERKSRYWCGLCKKSLCQTPCYDEYHGFGTGTAAEAAD